jgi:hypothetical protein
MLAIIFVGSASALADEKPVEIPLREVWALDMPGTRNIHDLEGKTDGDNSLMAVIGRALQARNERKVGKAFAVQGSGLTALKAAFAVITKQRPSARSLSGEVSVVFFTHESPYYVHLAKVTREGKGIRVEYEIVPHQTKELTIHFALIPLGELPSGDYNVDIVAKPMAKKYVEVGFKEISDEKKALIVSSFFKFHVD